jgi:hypothetical protein
MVVLRRLLHLQGLDQPDRRLDPKTWQLGRIANVVLGEIRANKLPTYKIKIEVQFAPRAPFALGFVLFLRPFALVENPQPSAVNDQMNPGLTVDLWLCLQRQTVAPARQGGEIRYRDHNPNTFAMERINPRVWRSGL